MKVLQIEFYKDSPFDFNGWIELDNGKYTFQDRFFCLHGNISFDNYYNEKIYKWIVKNIKDNYKDIDNFQSVKIVFKS